MAKIKNESSSYWNALTQLIAIIKTEYPTGGKLPPAPEMSRRLNVSRMTYGKALKTVCTHGLAAASRGRGGTLIPPPMRSSKKIGLVLMDAAESPFVTHAGEFSAILKELLSLLRRHSSNLNQLVRRVNTTGRVYEADLADIAKRQEQLWESVREVLNRLASIS